MDTVVAAFDFDGTLTRGDTLLPFLRILVGRRRVATVLAANGRALARAGRDRGERDVVKERVLASCLAGMHVDVVSAAALAHVDHIRMRDDVVAKLRTHQAAGHHVLVVSASPTIYVAPAMQRFGVDDVLATDLEIGNDGVLTGRLAGPNCRGEEKVVRLDAWLAGRDVELHAYGNSPDDAPMLARAHHAVWV
ncbi:MAG: phosphatidylglycerophosphatase [Actinomycetota bacterium]|nr:phosphatidylglycerophosphatase [Actinomycetota bacterium]